MSTEKNKPVKKRNSNKQIELTENLLEQKKKDLSILENDIQDHKYRLESLQSERRSLNVFIDDIKSLLTPGWNQVNDEKDNSPIGSNDR